MKERNSVFTLEGEGMNPETHVETKLQQQQQHDYTYHGSQQLQPGQKMYRFKMPKGPLEVVDLKREKTFDMQTKDMTPVAKINAEADCIYIPALNEKNAMRKILKMFGFRVNRKGKVFTDMEVKQVSPEEMARIQQEEGTVNFGHTELQQDPSVSNLKIEKGEGDEQP
jgi:hypothetical protein